MNTSTEYTTDRRGEPQYADDGAPPDTDQATQLERMRQLEDAARVAMAWSPADG